MKSQYLEVKYLFNVIKLASAAMLIILAALNYFSGVRTSSLQNLYLGLSVGDWSLVVVVLTFLPLFAPVVLSKKTIEEADINPRLFGFEGYMPIENIEEKLWGCHTGRLSWSTCGSSLSRHKSGNSYNVEAAFDLESGRGYAVSGINGAQTSAAEPMDPGTPTVAVKYLDPGTPTVAVEPMDPVGDGIGELDHLLPRPTLRCLKERAKEGYGQMKTFTLVDTGMMEVTLFEAVRPPIALMVGASEGGMRRALACSLDIVTGTFHRETVLRLHAPTGDKMCALARIRLGLRSPWGSQAVEEVPKAPTERVEVPGLQNLRRQASSFFRKVPGPDVVTSLNNYLKS